MKKNDKEITFSQYLFIILSEMKNHLISIAIIFILYFLLWEFPQTKDLLLVLYQTESNHIHNMLLFFASLSVLAFLISNIQDYFFSKKTELNESEEICKEALLKDLEILNTTNKLVQSKSKKPDIVPRDNIQIDLKKMDKSYSIKNRRLAFHKQVEITRKCESPKTYVRRMDTIPLSV